MPRPVLQAMVLADHVYQDRLSGKYIIAGTFGRIALRMPTPTQPAAAAPAASPPAAKPTEQNWQSEIQVGPQSPTPQQSSSQQPSSQQPSSQPPAAAKPNAPAAASTPSAPAAGEAKQGGERVTHSLESATAQISVSGSPFLYLALTGIHGKTSLSIRFLNLADGAAIFDAVLDVASTDPVAMAEYCVPMPPLPCSKPGTYSLDLLHSGEILGSWRIQAVAG